MRPALAPARNPVREVSQNLRYRWFIISLAILLNMTISIYQYSWSLFANNLQEELGWSLAAVSLTFTIFQLTNFSQPFSGALADARGPKGVGIVSALLVGLGFILSSQASALPGSCGFVSAWGASGWVLWPPSPGPPQ